MSNISKGCLSLNVESMLFLLSTIKSFLKIIPNCCYCFCYLAKGQCYIQNKTKCLIQYRNDAIKNHEINILISEHLGRRLIKIVTPPKHELDIQKRLLILPTKPINLHFKSILSNLLKPFQDCLRQHFYESSFQIDVSARKHQWALIS